MFIVVPILVLLATAAINVSADPNPNSPGPGDVFVEGRPCAVSWDADQTGRWKTMHIDLMTGDNFDMVFLANVGTVDGTDTKKATFTYTCPQVKPHSAIYFYQFSTPSSSNKTWTGRFTITNSKNDTVAPSQSTQPNGEKIPWGTGSLVDAARSPAPRSSFADSGAEGTGASDSRPEASVVAVSGGIPVLTSKPSGSPRPSSVTPNATSEDPHLFAPSSSDHVTAAPSTSPTPDTGKNGTAAMRPVSGILLWTVLALVLAALGFVAIS